MSAYDPKRIFLSRLSSVVCVKFAVAFQIEIALHIPDGKQVSDLWPDADNLRLERA